MKNNKETAILNVIEKNPKISNPEIVTKTGISRETVRLAVKKMVEEGKVVKIEEGKVATFMLKVAKTTAKTVATEMVKTPAVKKTVKSTETKEVRKDLNQNNDRTKVLINGIAYGKGRAALKMVTDFCKNNPNANFQDLKANFPDRLHRKYGVVALEKDALEKCKIQKRYFIKEEEIIKLKDGSRVCVCSDFGKSNIPNFLRHCADNLKMKSTYDATA